MPCFRQGRDSLPAGSSGSRLLGAFGSGCVWAGPWDPSRLREAYRRREIAVAEPGALVVDQGLCPY
jgi:hypothetical protein